MAPIAVIMRIMRKKGFVQHKRGVAEGFFNPVSAMSKM